MSPVDAYVAELRAALGDRLSPSVTTARLREVRAHLLESARESSESEAVRRYGRSRSVAGGLVRGHRGYGTKSSWSLALPLAAGFLTTGVASILVRAVPSVAAARLFGDLGRCALLLFVAAFVLRATQTRRWIAGPMAVAHGVGGLLVLLLAHTVAPSPWTLGEFQLLVFYGLLFGAAWLALNALALGAGGLLDLRRVRRAR